ncbi:MAG TPA: exodeoxyribonuclease VII small subunit [Candidatus Limnocylindria bacterium]|nr:exodeoxyribonuclease VII small subunit [Candidatus Limnocylindria bacterium]
MTPKPTPRTPNDAGAEAPSFEQALARLETIVSELEAGSLSLEDSMARYEEGMRLSRTLTLTLDEAEKRIERLVESEGQPTTEPLELDLERAEERTTKDELPF